MASERTSLSRLRALYRGWSAPVIRALYLRDADSAQAALNQARDAAAQLHLTADEACAAGYYFAYLDYTITRALGAVAEQTPAFHELLARLQAASAGEISNTVRRLLLLQQKMRGEHAGYGELTSAEFYALFNFIPVEARDLELWHQVAGWAFLHMDSELLERAYEVFVVAPRGPANQYPFHRVRLMHAILQGRVSKAEVASYCARLTAIHEVHETRNVIWPRLRELGLIDSELDGALDAAVQRIKVQVAHTAAK